MSAFDHLQLRDTLQGQPCPHLGYLTSAKDAFWCYCCQCAESLLSPRPLQLPGRRLRARSLGYIHKEQFSSFFLNWASPPIGLANSEWWLVGPLSPMSPLKRGVEPGYIPASPSLCGLNGFVSAQQVPKAQEGLRESFPTKGLCKWQGRVPPCLCTCCSRLLVCRLSLHQHTPQHLSYRLWSERASCGTPSPHPPTSVLPPYLAPTVLELWNCVYQATCSQRASGTRSFLSSTPSHQHSVGHTGVATSSVNKGRGC